MVYFIHGPEGQEVPLAKQEVPLTSDDDWKIEDGKAIFCFYQGGKIVFKTTSFSELKKYVASFLHTHARAQAV